MRIVRGWGKETLLEGGMRRKMVGKEVREIKRRPNVKKEQMFARKKATRKMKNNHACEGKGRRAEKRKNQSPKGKSWSAVPLTC